MFGNLGEMMEQAKTLQFTVEKTVDEFRQNLAQMQLDINRILENQNEILRKLERDENVKRQNLEI